MNVESAHFVLALVGLLMSGPSRMLIVKRRRLTGSDKLVISV